MLLGYILYGGKGVVFVSKTAAFIVIKSARRLPSIYMFEEETFPNGGPHCSSLIVYHEEIPRSTVMIVALD